MKKKSLWLFLFLILILVSGLTVWIIWSNPNETVSFIPCFIKRSTGWYCPTCGLTRGLQLFFQGDFQGAFWMNPLIGSLFIMGSIYMISFVIQKVRKKPIFVPPFWFWMVLLFLIVVFTVARNVFSF